MSDTIRWVQWGHDGWTSKKGLPRSKKHQMKDRGSLRPKHQFSKGMRNSLYNLERKNEELSEKESLSDMSVRKIKKGNGNGLA